MKKNDFHDLMGVIFDLDGTLYLGERALPGAVALCAELKRRGVRVAFVSNKPLEERSAYAEKLNRLGIEALPEQVITSAFVLGTYLRKEHPDLCYYVVGEENLRRELRLHGLHLAGDMLEQDAFQVIHAEDVQAVVIAFDRTLDYRKLNIAYQALMRGARFFATNIDKACPMPGGAIPDAGITIAALEAGTGRKLELAAGKPSRLILQAALELLDAPAERCLMVGDRLETDIRMGREAGMLTALVLTGVSRRSDLDGCSNPPNLVLENLTEFLHLLG
jgi:phosphoglycolate/pyridoxal phosphate phosphatase family enzyme